MDADKKVEGKFLVRKVNGTNFVLKHVNSETITVVEPISSHYSDDNTGRLVDELTENDIFTGQIINVGNNGRHVWSIKRVDKVSSSQA